ncbi:LysR substrate-binding domain-containing protein [Vibrio europaeus]|uniref:LysR substrate-binding domain-containing protein n=1 Tax=Vibrio europaeus TaxID=300876 RepID=UPI00233F6DAB|nr:LysR substrate-binding domain-containing protein [Vibrio europaeus]MDC5870783.1 LysR substrate-binding domain-containing protein [Vibrio europaeus]
MKRIIPAPIKSLYAFVAVAETGSMTEAASALYVSHSAISQAIKSLEKHLGQSLFNRVGRHVTLNATGRQYYKNIAPDLEQITRATHQLIEDKQSHRLTLNMVNSLAMHWWIPRVNQLNQYAPNLDVRISTLIGTFVMEDEGVDVAVIHGKVEDWQDYYCEKLADDELIMVASPELAADYDSPIALLKKYPAIIAANDRRKHDWQVWCEANNTSIPNPANNLKFGASIQAVQAAIRHLGVFVTHRIFVRDDVQQGYLVEIGEPVLNPHQEFYFACLPGKLKNENVLQLRSWIRREFSKNTRLEQ